jgi:hypothetical protein
VPTNPLSINFNFSGMMPHLSYNFLLFLNKDEAKIDASFLYSILAALPLLPYSIAPIFPSFSLRPSHCSGGGSYLSPKSEPDSAFS